MKKTITDGYVRRGIKRHWSIVDFANDMNVSEEAFWKLLESSFNNERQRKYYQREIRKNFAPVLQKKQKTQGTTTLDVIQEQTESIQEQTESIQEQTESIQEQTESIQNVVQQVSIKEIESEIYELESKINDLSSQKEAFFEELKSEKELLERVMISIKETQKKIEYIKREILTINDTHRCYKKLLSEKKCILKKIRRKEVFVYSDGTVTGIELPPEIDTKIYEQLIGQVDAESLTVREIKSLTRLISYIKNNSDFIYEIIFESIATQQLFEKY